jgi:Fe-S cluster assembly ATP-binding protein
MLDIKNLHVKLEAEDKAILKGVDLKVEAGKVHAIMGPNGSGKSTLSYVLSGRDGYAVTAGSAHLDGQDLLALEPEERAAAGLGLGLPLLRQPQRRVARVRADARRAQPQRAEVSGAVLPRSARRRAREGAAGARMI